MNEDQIKKAIEKVIKQIESEYKSTQGMILTEDDLKSIIFQKLSNNYSKITNPQQTEDKHIKAPMLHTELSWYDNKGKLTIKPDITILDPRYLSILHRNGEKVRLPSKAYSFRGNAVLLELKFIKNQRGITKATINGPLLKDINKINRLFHKLDEQGAPYDLYCYFIVFNKTNKKCPEFDKFLKHTNSYGRGKYKMIYATGNVDFDNKL